MVCLFFAFKRCRIAYFQVFAKEKSVYRVLNLDSLCAHMGCRLARPSNIVMVFHTFLSLSINVATFLARKNICCSQVLKVQPPGCDVNGWLGLFSKDWVVGPKKRIGYGRVLDQQPLRCGLRNWMADQLCWTTWLQIYPRFYTRPISKGRLVSL